MVQGNRFCGLLLLSVALGLDSSSELRAQQPAQFPWGNQSAVAQGRRSSDNVYSVLPTVLQDKHHRQDAPAWLYPAPMKHAYSYGWFGSNPSHHWGRHFGNTRSYTQWSRR